MASESVKLNRDPKVRPADVRFGTRVVAFVDVIGAKAQDSSLDFVRSLVTSIADERRLWQKWPEAERIGFRSLWFSDNLGASVPVAEATDDRSAAGRAFDIVGWYAASVQARLLREHGLASRAGIAIGDCLHLDHMIFGPALVAAVRAEHTAAVPRLLLDESATDASSESVVPVSSEGSARFVDFLDVGLPDAGSARTSYLTDVRGAIEAGPDSIDVDDDNRDRQFGSWTWLAGRFDALVERVGEQHAPLGELPTPW